MLDLVRSDCGAVPLRIFFSFLFSIALAVSSCAARADEVTFPDLRDAVPGAEGVTYFDLARLVLPDLEAADGAWRGSQMIETRHIGGANMGASPSDEFAVHDAAVLPLRADGRDRLALLFDLGRYADGAEGLALLALYEPGNAPALLDVAQVGFDRYSGFRTPVGPALSADDDLVLTASAHSNSNQTYMTSAMVMVRAGRLQLVDTVFTFGDRGCGYERVQTPEFSVGASGGRAYADIVVRVTEATRLTDDACDGAELPEEKQRRIEVIYRWDDAAARFVPDSDALERLARENETRF